MLSRVARLRGERNDRIGSILLKNSLPVATEKKGVARCPSHAKSKAADAQNSLFAERDDRPGNCAGDNMLEAS